MQVGGTWWAKPLEQGCKQHSLPCRLKQRPFVQGHENDGSFVRGSTETRGKMKTESEGHNTKHQPTRLSPRPAGRFGSRTKEGHESAFACCAHPHVASGREAAWMAHLLPPPTKQTDKRRAKIFMRLARVEQAAFGTGIRRANHCATTPLDFCLFSGNSGLSGRNGPGSISSDVRWGIHSVGLLGRGGRRGGGGCTGSRGY